MVTLFDVELAYLARTSWGGGEIFLWVDSQRQSVWLFCVKGMCSCECS